MYLFQFNQLHNMFHPLAPAEAQHAYSTLYQDSKVSYQPSHECSLSNKQVDAVYAMITETKQDDAAL